GQRERLCEVRTLRLLEQDSQVEEMREFCVNVYAQEGRHMKYRVTLTDKENGQEHVFDRPDKAGQMKVNDALRSEFKNGLAAGEWTLELSEAD
ncbi:MAG: hypothetical protein QF415_12595, partial [Candidatus Undinarchaeales archaeon]|nr:hypothetical protein [Candidatus Undinarchaeales archaeon]